MDIGKKIKNYIFRFFPLQDYYGKDFKKIYAFLMESRYWDKEQILDYKLDRLKAMVRHAEKNVPYYRDLFKKEGISSNDIKGFDDYAKLPILTKNILRENLDSLKADNFESYKPIRTQTSGTTSNITRLFRSKYHEHYRKAAVWRFMNNFNCHFRDKRLTIACRSFDINTPIADHDKIENNMILSTFHIMSGRCEEAVKIIRDYSPKLIWTHPSSLAILGEYILENDLPPIEIPTIITFSEKFYPYVRKILEKSFPAKYIDYYGNRENSIAAWGYSDDKFYEISEYCHLEVENISSFNQDSTGAGDLISTSLHNYAFPLIRYLCEDIANWHGYTDNEIPYPVVELVGGRGKDLLVTRDGYTVPYFIAYVEKKGFNKVKKYQMEQLNLDEVLIRFVPKENYNREKDEPLLLKYARESIAGKFKIRLEYVDDIPLTKKGKYLAVISNLAVDDLRSKHINHM